MDNIKKIEGRAYAKGYAAGRRRVESDIEREIRQERDRIRWDAYFCAALQGTLMNSGWQTGGKRWESDTDYVKGCARFADEAMKHARNKP